MTHSRPPHQSPIPPSMPGSDCEIFGQAAALRVDRELGRAEEAALEAHLETCAACRARARQSEALSALLRRWDAERAGRVEPPARLRLAIRSAVAEEGRWRRDEWRSVRLVKLATAAAVLLTLGAATALGFAVSRAQRLVSGVPVASATGFSEPGASGVGTVSATPLSDPRGAAPVEDGRAIGLYVPEETVSAPAELDASALRPSGWLGAEERAQAIETLAFYEAMRHEREVFEMVCGEPAVWWRAPGSGMARLITITALDHLISLGFTSVEDYAEDPSRDRTMPADVDPSAIETAAVVDTGRRLSDYFALPAAPRGREALLRVPVANLRDGIRVYAIPAHGVPRAGGALPAPMGLAEAVLARTVSLGEGNGDDLVAIVRGTAQPIFVPAGELLDGGRVHRMTVQPVWIPATSGTGDVRVTIPCLAVSTSNRAREGSGAAAALKTVVPTGLLAPPAIRRLLAEGGNVRRIQAWLKGRLPYLRTAARAGDYSLVASYPPQIPEGMALLHDALLRVRARGIVVVDAEGNLLGVEVTELPPAVAATLLTRAVLSYSAEDYLQDFVRASEPSAPLWRDAALPSAESALARLTDDVRTLTARELPGRARRERERGAIRRLRTALPAARTTFEIVERPEDGAVVFAFGVTK